MAYVSERKYKVTAVAATTATMVPVDAHPGVNEVTEVKYTWATARPVEFAIDKMLAVVRIQEV